MLPSPETCRRWSKRKFIRQPFRMVGGMLLCFIVAVVAVFNEQWGAVRLFGALGGFFLLIYAAANWIVWRAGEVPDEQ